MTVDADKSEGRKKRKKILTGTAAYDTRSGQSSMNLEPTGQGKKKKKG
jgi:hypothetical protein